MKGFEINYNDEIRHVAVSDGLLMIHVSHIREKSYLHVGAVDYENHIKMVWYDNVPINIGASIDIKFTEITHISEPVKGMHDESIKRPFSKLDMFLRLEQHLKNRGLL